MMFGHDNDQQVAGNATTQPVTASAIGLDDQMVSSAPPINEAAGDYIATAIPGQSTAPVTTVTPVEPAEPVEPEISTANTITPTVTVNGTNDDDLLDIKQQALQQLAPLISHLDQTPEEKFRTTMMMIQASDNDSLIKQAYDAAQQITDEKTRAQALLDIVNEINYFTQQHATEN